ncbi:MAG: DUF2809 domain-containing protein [Bacteroidota bacterium]
MKIRPPYAILAVIIFIVEVLIAIYVKEGFVRHTLGDVLVVVLIYCTIQTFWDLPVIPAAIGVLVFAYLVEMMQYFHIVEILGLEQNRLARIVIGTSFSWGDIVAYTIGVLCIVFAEFLIERK